LSIQPISFLYVCRRGMASFLIAPATGGGSPVSGALAAGGILPCRAADL
jgi:hypothetical protein